jgi:hypothetical protein
VRYSVPIQTGARAHPASYTTCTWLFLGCSSLVLTTHPLVLKLESIAVPLLHLQNFMAVNIKTSLVGCVIRYQKKERHQFLMKHMNQLGVISQTKLPVTSNTNVRILENVQDDVGLRLMYGVEILGMRNN